MKSSAYHIVTFLLTLLVTFPLLAQKEARLYEKANSFFSDHQYNQALKIYREASTINPRFEDVEYKMEICLLLTAEGDNRPLDRFLGFETTYGRSDDHYFYWLGKIYIRRYQINEAIQSFERFQQQVSYSGTANEQETQELIIHSLSLKEFFENPDDFEIHHLESPVNSDSAELTPVFFSGNNELLFASNRNGSGEKPFSIYYVKKSGSEWATLAQISTLGNFSRENTNIEVVNSDRRLFQFREEKGGDLFYSEVNGDSWSSPIEFDSRVSNNQIASHFFINEHEDRIIFASDINKSGLDIYESFKDPENEKWSKPQPFFSTINSPYDEDSPYLSPDEKRLYFCSNRPGGVGSYDIYYSEFDETSFTWSEPVNMGWPINSPDDEIHFKLNTDQVSGYFVSDRLHSLGDYDIYYFWHIEKVKVEGRIFDQLSGGPLQNAEIRFHPSQYLDEFFTSRIDPTGRYSTKIISDETFYVEIIKNGSVIYEDKFEIHDSKGELTTHIKDFTVN